MKKSVQTENETRPLRITTDCLIAGAKNLLKCSRSGKHREVVCPRCNGSGQRTGGYENGDIICCPKTVSSDAICIDLRLPCEEDLCNECAVMWHALQARKAIDAVVVAAQQREDDAQARVVVARYKVSNQQAELRSANDRVVDALTELRKAEESLAVLIGPPEKETD